MHVTVLRVFKHSVLFRLDSMDCLHGNMCRNGLITTVLLKRLYECTAIMK